MCSSEHFSDVYKDYSRDKFYIYGNDRHFCGYNLLESGILKPIIEMLNPIYPEFLSSNYYNSLIDNSSSTALLENSEVSKNNLYDDYHYAFMGMPYTLEETELENIRLGKTLLRVNDKNHQIIYTVSKSGDWYVFKNFSLVKGNFGHEKNCTKLLLRSVWCVKQLPDIKKFDMVIPNVTKMDDVINIDPSFRYFEENGVLYSTHTFADEKSTRISIEYKKDSMGIYRVSNVVRVQEGYNLLPYLLPIDRQLIDPNYVPPTDENPGCNVM